MLELTDASDLAHSTLSCVLVPAKGCGRGGRRRRRVSFVLWQAQHWHLNCLGGDIVTRVLIAAVFQSVHLSRTMKALEDHLRLVYSLES